MTTELSQSLFALLNPVLTEAQFELVDVTLSGSVLQVLLDRSADHPLGSRIDLDGVSEATKIVDAVLEKADPIGDPYTLEVSSPGLERPLRTPAHYRRFLGAVVTVKTRAGVLGERRVEGILNAADPEPDGSVTIDTREIPYTDIERARTVFVWGGQSKAAKGAKGSAGANSRKPHPKQAGRTTNAATTNAATTNAATTNAATTNAATQNATTKRCDN